MYLNEEVTGKTKVSGCRLILAFFVGSITTSTSPAKADGLLEYGEYLSSECVACHRTDEVSDSIPSILGHPEDYFIEVLMEYRMGKREHEIMQNVASSLGEDEMKALARYFNQLSIGEQKP